MMGERVKGQSKRLCTLLFCTVAIMCDEDGTTIEHGTTAGPSKSRMSDQQVALILGAINKSQVEMQALRREM